MTRLIITRGLPGCGKTTFARAWVAEDREHRARVNRDDIRAMLDDGQFVQGVTEPRVLAARDAAILSLLSKGIDTICDDTNLPQRTARDLAKLAKRAGGELAVIDLTDVPLDTCLKRNADRTDKIPVPEPAIRDMHARYLAGRSYPLPLPEESAAEADGLVRYEPKPGTPKAVLVDIDGTTALHVTRGPYDEDRVGEDVPNGPVIEVVRALHSSGYRIVFVSGRTQGCLNETVMWLKRYVAVPFDGPFMRTVGDSRRDTIVKAELFDRRIRYNYDVRMTIDDRASVVAMWRGLGLTCLAVADGNF